MQNSLTKRKRRGRRNIKERRSEDPVSEKDEVRNQKERSAKRLIALTTSQTSVSVRIGQISEWNASVLSNWGRFRFCRTEGGFSTDKQPVLGNLCHLVPIRFIRQSSQSWNVTELGVVRRLFSILSQLSSTQFLLFRGVCQKSIVETGRK